jgi:tetratricopeptide (TPR) repeat protein
MRWQMFVAGALLIGTSWAQQTGASGNNGSSAPASSPTSDQNQSQPKDAGSKRAGSSNADPANTGSSNSSHPPTAPNPHLAAPQSDRVDASALEDGESSSKDSQIDLSPPPEDAKKHPGDSDVLVDEGSGTSDTSQFQYWDPHKAAKDVEVGDYYFKRKNYIAAEDRYREALLYKANDAVATFRLAQCLDKMTRTDEARTQYEVYLKILPNGPESEQAKKALARLKTPEIAKPAK